MTIEIIPDPQPQDDKQIEFEEFAATMPETAQGFLDVDPTPSPNVGDAEPTTGADDFLGGPSPSDSAPTPRKRVNVTKKVRRAMDRLKVKIANMPIMWFHQQARNNPEWELDADEKELIRDAVSTVFDVLDIGVEIEPLSWTLTSVWWVVSYPVLAFVFLFLTKKSMMMDNESGQPDEEPQP